MEFYIIHCNDQKYRLGSTVQRRYYEERPDHLVTMLGEVFYFFNGERIQNVFDTLEESLAAVARLEGRKVPQEE